MRCPLDTMEKKALSERDICTKFITPALRKAGWDEMLQIREEVSFTKGRIIVRGKLVSRGQAKRADYILYIKPNIPLALIEAKDNSYSVGDGMQQGLEYAATLDIPFVFSSNGDGFVFHDRTGKSASLETSLGLDAFPSPAALWARYRTWKGLDAEAEKIVLQDYYDDGSGKAPRYYQVNAVNAAIEAIAKGQNRILLVMATGTGKTYTAFQIIWRLWKAGRKKRILFLADRNVLIDQTMVNDFRPFGGVMAKLSARSGTIENALPPLTARPDQIKQLRQTILNLAVRGKLVPQNPNDEPASELLKDIRKTRKKLYAEKRIPKPKELPSIDEVDLPFSMPSGWAWSMLGDLCYQASDGPHFSPQYVAAGEGVPFLSARNIRLGAFDLSTVKHVSRADHEEFSKRIRPEKGDIIYTKGGTTGIAKVNDLDFEFSVWVHLAVLRIEKKRLYPRYVELALNSPHCYAQSQHYTQGTSNFDLGLTRMIKITLPLPPLAEQHRIVAKVDALMGLCDRLEASLTATTATRRRLLHALLAEALAPAEHRELEAAE